MPLDTQHQIIYICNIDIHVKFENERLRYITFNQAKLYSEEYIHSCDAIVGNVDERTHISKIRTAYILPSFIGNLHHI